jgi:uncharacterized protein (DUF1330 family)
VSIADDTPVIAVFEVRLQPNPGASAEAGYAEYKSRVAPMIEAAGGRYLTRAAAGEFLEGGPSDAVDRRFHVIEFPSASAARAFWWSAEYAEIVPLREGAVDVTATIIAR